MAAQVTLVQVQRSGFGGFREEACWNWTGGQTLGWALRGGLNPLVAPCCWVGGMDPPAVPWWRKVLYSSVCVHVCVCVCVCVRARLPKEACPGCATG